MAAYSQLRINQQEFDFIEKLVINSSETPAILRAKFVVERARLDELGPKRPVGRPAKPKPTREERQAELIKQGYVWITYQGERSLWPADHLPVGGIRDDGSEIKHTAI